MSQTEIDDINLWAGNDHTIKLYISPGGDNWSIYSSELGYQVNTTTISMSIYNQIKIKFSYV